VNQEIDQERREAGRDRHGHDDGDKPDSLAGAADGALDHVPLADAAAKDLKEYGDKICNLHARYTAISRTSESAPESRWITWSEGVDHSEIMSIEWISEPPESSSPLPWLGGR
jgi:hypothetical protein